MNDSKIIELFFSEKGNRTSSYLKKIDSNTEIKNYLDQRFKNCSDYNEILWRIKLGYEEVPLCPVCGEHRLKFYGSCQIGYSQTCSKQCQHKLWHNNQVQTVKEKYGVENCFQSEECKKKIRETNLERYGTEILLADPKIREKYAEINLKKYGVRNGGGSKQAQDKIKKHMLETYGVINPGQIDFVKKKIRETMHKNNSFHKSKPEEYFYNKLQNLYPDTKRQYRSDLYPFNCDFYIPSKDLYIECNFHWTHGKHMFDKNNQEDINKLNEWKSKNSPYYKAAANTWSIRDINKFETAEKNNLNYKAFYTESEAEEYIKRLEI